MRHRRQRQTTLHERPRPRTTRHPAAKRRKRCGWITAGVVAGGLWWFVLPLAGCDLISLFVQLTPAPAFDFARLARDVDMALDVTEVNLGWQRREDVRRRWATPDVRVEFVTIPEIRMTYMLRTNPREGSYTVVLPGTSRPRHVMIDLGMRPSYDQDLGVSFHTGFRIAALAVRADLADRLMKPYPVRVVGYSMGGAIAVILAAHLDHDGYDVSRIVTLGQPAVTNADGAARLAHLPLLRLIAGDDPIVWWTERNYTQFGPAIILLDGPYIVYLPPDDPDYDLAAKLLSDVDDDRMHDHATYRERIASKVGTDVYEVRFADRSAFLAPPALVP